MLNYFIYPIFTIIVGAAALLIIPKEQYKHYVFVSCVLVTAQI